MSVRVNNGGSGSSSGGTASTSNTAKHFIQEREDYFLDASDNKNVLVLAPINVDKIKIGNNSSIKFL